MLAWLTKYKTEATLLLLAAAVGLGCWQYLKPSRKSTAVTSQAEALVVTKVETKIVYVDRVVYKEVEKAVYRDRTVTKKVTKPDGTIIDTVIIDKGTTEYKENESKKDLGVTVDSSKEDTSRVVTSHSTTTSTSSYRSLYSLGVSYNIDKDIFTKADLRYINVEGGVRLGGLPLWTTVAVSDLGRVYRVGLRIEF